MVWRENIFKGNQSGLLNCAAALVVVCIQRGDGRFIGCTRF